jgi:hypothetical protein
MTTRNPSTSTALRVWLGHFLVDYVETFVALIPAMALAWIVTPALHFTDLQSAKIAAIAWIVQLIGPAASALVSAGRRALVTAWPSVKAYLDSGFGAAK